MRTRTKAQRPTRWRTVKATILGRGAAARLGLTTMMIAGAATVLSTTTSGTAVAVAGVPNAPVVVYQEGFENNTGTAIVPLTSYTGSAGTKYAADASWLTACNGQIMEYNAPVSELVNSNCTRKTAAENLDAFNALRSIAYVLGTLNGSADANTNHALSAYTDGANPGANLISFRTNPATPIVLPATTTSRFLTFSVNAMATSCWASGPQYNFFLDHASLPDIQIGSTMSVCPTPYVTNPYTKDGVPLWGGTYTSNGSFLFDGLSFGVVLRNANGSGSGNDAGFDDIKILDVTPAIDKSFVPAVLGVNGTSTLTFTITNTSELASKTDWGFVDTLPADLVVAPVPNISGSCVNRAGAPLVRTAAAGATSITISGGDFQVGEVSCTVSVDVTSSLAGTYTNGAANVTTTGLVPPPNATVQFININAVDDPYGTQALGATTGTVLANDTLDGASATTGNVDLTPGTPSNPNLTMNADGTITIGSTTPPGSYSYPYTICSKTTPAVCDSATATLNVGSVINAVDDPFGTQPLGATTSTVLTNDTLNGNPVSVGAGGNVTLTPGTSPNPNLTMNADGTITVGPNTPPGNYSYPYTICSIVNPGVCDTAVATLDVGSVINAVDDPFGNQNPGAVTGTVLTNDTLNGNPVSAGAGGNVTLTPGTPSNPNLTMNANGTINVGVNTPPGSYSYPYTICSIVNPAICDTAIATVSVGSAINAVDDPFGTQALGATTATVLTNDTLNGNPVSAGAGGNVALTPGTPSNPNLTMNANGTINVGVNTPPGNYSYPYTICSIVNPAICDVATATLNVGSVINAVDDPFGPQAPGAITGTVLTNDTLNGNPATISTVTLTPGSPSNPNLTMNPDGTITVGVNTPPGNYGYPYTICSIVNQAVCDTAVATVSVTSVIDAVDDPFGSQNPGATTGTVLVNDTLNGNPATTSNVVLTPGTPSAPTLTMNPAGTITVSAGTPPGNYSYPYTICSIVNPATCDSATATLNVGSVINAVDDPFGLQNLGATTGSVLVNDTLNGNPATTSNVTLTPGTPSNPNLTMNPDGTIVVGSNTPPGSYSYPYAICSIANPGICDTATATLTVGSVINAVDDPFGTQPLGATTSTVLTNDTLNGNPVSVGAGGNISLTPGAPSNPNLTMNADGTIAVGATTPPGSYSYPYTICSIVNPAVCDIAIATLDVGSVIDAIDDPFGNQTLGAVTGSVLANDTLNGNPATTGTVSLTPGTPSNPNLTMNANGTINVGVNTPPGSYSYPYTICSIVNPAICDTATATLTVGSAIDAIDDPFGTQTLGATTATVLANDTLNGNPVSLGAGGNVTLTPGTPSNPNLTMNADGTITVGATTPPGSYSYPYTICSIVNPAICDVATATLNVGSVINAVDDPFGPQAPGAITGSVLPNDTLNGNPASTANVTLTTGTSPNSNLTMNPDGTVAVGLNTPPGTYAYPYTICSIVNPGICDSAEATLTVTSVINAIDDPFGNQAPGATTGSVLVNDTLNGNPATTSNVTLTPGTPSDPHLTMSPGGAITVGATTPPGSYSYPYTICSIVDPATCDTATATLTVGSAIDAVDDPLGSQTPGATTPTVLLNDTLNGNSVTISTVTLTPGTPSDPHLTMNPDGTITVGATTPPGSYSYPYTICSIANPDVCDTATATLIVPAVINAVDDPFGTQTPGVTTPSVLGNDTLNGNPVSVGAGGNISLTPGTPSNPGLVMNPDGTITVDATTPPGTYTYPYTICSIVINGAAQLSAKADAGCDTATATLTVKPVVDAIDDPFGTHTQGGSTPSVTVNDTLNGMPATPGGNVVLTPGMPSNPGLTMNSDGSITVGSSTPAGTYTYPYTICSIVDPDVCDNATATITVVPSISASGPTAPAGSAHLPTTGNNALESVKWSLSLMALGLFGLVVARRRRAV